MTEIIKQMMTDALGESGVSFVKRGQHPEIGRMETLKALATRDAVTGNVLYALKLCGYDFGRGSRLDQDETRIANGTETLIVPGYASSNCAFTTLRGFLEEYGIHSHPIRDFQDLRLRKPFSAEEAAALVQRRIEESKAARVDIICHSMGGVNALIGCQELRGEAREKVGRIITLGTPWEGAPLAKYLHELRGDDKALRDLSPGSDILTKKLPKVEDDIRRRVISVGSVKDGIVPWKSAILDGSHLNAVLRNGSAVTHANYLHKPHIADAVAGILKMAA